MPWLIALGAILALGFFPLGVIGTYSNAGGELLLTVGPLKFRLYPRNKKPKLSKAQAAETEYMPKGEKGTLSDFLPIFKSILDLLGDLRRRLRVKRLEMKLIMAGEDPCDLAVGYGRAWAVLGNLQPLLDRLFVIRNKDLQILCDFTREQSQISARLELNITAGRLLGLTVRYGLRLLREYIIMKNHKKAVQ